MSTDSQASIGTVMPRVIHALASARAVPPEVIKIQLDAEGGDIAIDSKEAELVIALVEGELGLGELADASDLCPEQLTSVASISSLLVRRPGD